MVKLQLIGNTSIYNTSKNDISTLDGNPPGKGRKGNQIEINESQF
jgi:hypothetical protein